MPGVVRVVSIIWIIFLFQFYTEVKSEIDVFLDPHKVPTSGLIKRMLPRMRRNDNPNIRISRSVNIANEEVLPNPRWRRLIDEKDEPPKTYIQALLRRREEHKKLDAAKKKEKRRLMLLNNFTRSKYDTVDVDNMGQF